MFETGEVVVYEGAGVCVIEEIRIEKFNKESRLYYVLKPVKEKSTTIYFPVDGDGASFVTFYLKKRRKRSLLRIILRLNGFLTIWQGKNTSTKSLRGKTDSGCFPCFI